jgi:nitrilase
MTKSEHITLGLAQLAPVWLDRAGTMEKILKTIQSAGKQGCDLVAFGEALLPGYPFWVENTQGAKFNSPLQKEIHAHYMQEAVQISAGDLGAVCSAAADNHLAVVLGCIERAEDRGGHSLYASLVYINAKGQIESVHRKVMPTYEERLTWAQGDGHGLQVHSLGAFTVGGLNCWENWMPLMRSALYGLGEDLHIAIWPGNLRNTVNLTRFIAEESRSFVASVSGLMRREDISPKVPHAQMIAESSPEVMADGGTCLAGPDGAWIIEPKVGSEGLFIAQIDQQRVREERQNFDPSGHYSRPDVVQLTVNRTRQNVLKIID